ncbi:TRAP transporter small permease [Fusobacterium sp. PH5-44]|uniref:TRAP transporter small permease n=1 Tax=unclassified Fusobacterium TaxID=2648384 RepID=UPI003D1E3705
MNPIKKLGKVVFNIYMGIGVTAMGLLASSVIFTVIARYCFSKSWKEVSEFNITLFAFTTFWSMGICVINNEHVIIDILYNKFSPTVKRIITVVNYVVVLIVDIFFIYFSYHYAMKLGIQKSQGMEIKMVYMYGIMPLSAFICAICIIIKMIETILSPLSAFSNNTTMKEELVD